MAVKMKISRIDPSGAIYLRFTERAIGILSQISNKIIDIRIKGRNETKISFLIDGINDGVIKIITELPDKEGHLPEDDEEVVVCTISEMMYMEGSRNLTLKAGEVTQSKLPQIIPKGIRLIR